METEVACSYTPRTTARRKLSKSRARSPSVSARFLDRCEPFSPNTKRDSDITGMAIFSWRGWDLCSVEKLVPFAARCRIS